MEAVLPIFFGVVLTAVVAYILVLGKKQREQALMLRFAMKKTKPFYAMMQEQLSTDLHHFKFPEADVLIEILETDPKAMTVEQRTALKAYMRERETDQTVSETERLKAHVMPYLMDIVLAEAASQTDANKET